MSDITSTKNRIHTFLHCRLCHAELKNAKTEEDYVSIGADPGESFRSFARFEVGWTNNGFQVRCTRHNEEIIIDIDYDNIDELKKSAKQDKKNRL